MSTPRSFERPKAGASLAGPGLTGPNPTAPLTKVRMVRSHLDNLPDHPLPGRFRLRCYVEGDRLTWCGIQAAADLHRPITPRLFDEQFGADACALGQRQLYLCAPGGEPIGTGTAWYGSGDRAPTSGRIHWVAVVPAWQGRGLSKPLLSAVCRRLRDLGHNEVYLITETVRVTAIRLYLSFGFVPEIKDDAERITWEGFFARHRDFPH